MQLTNYVGNEQKHILVSHASFEANLSKQRDAGSVESVKPI